MMRRARDSPSARMRGLRAAAVLGALALARADCEDYDNNCAVCVTETSWGMDCDFCWSEAPARKQLVAPRLAEVRLPPPVSFDWQVDR